MITQISYYYDKDTGLYYLQSRYYDPQTGRFVNSDDPEMASASNSILQSNLFAYCENNVVNCVDESGKAISRLVGVGLQIELAYGWITVGVEFIWYLISSIRNGRAWYNPYMYTYGAVGVSADLKYIISKLTKNPTLIFKPKNFSKIGLSISIFAIFGYSNFTNPISYTGRSYGVSTVLWNVKSYIAWSNNCLVVGIGYSTSKFSSSSGISKYIISYSLLSGLHNLYNTVFNKGKKIKK